MKPAVKDIRLRRQGRRELVQYVSQESLPGPSCPFKSRGVITGFIVITACFLKGQASQGSNPPVSTHINGLIGLFSPSQNAGPQPHGNAKPSEPPRA